ATLYQSCCECEARRGFALGELVKGADVRMIEEPRQSRLAEKHADRGVIRAEMWIERLDGNAPVERTIDRDFDRSHAAGRDAAFDLEALAGCPLYVVEDGFDARGGWDDDLRRLTRWNCSARSG